MESAERPSWFAVSYGLCANYGNMCRYELHDPHNLTDDCWGIYQSWPLFSGDAAFPVPADKKKFPHFCKEYDSQLITTHIRLVRTIAEYAYNHTDNMYDRRTEYGRNRRALLDYLIEQTNEEQ